MNDVYPVSEDTLLLIDAIKSIRERVPRGVEVGSGSGVVAEALAEKVHELHVTDISPKAVAETAQRLKQAGFWSRSHVVCCSLLSPYRERVFDVMVSNPPYLPPEGLGDRSFEGGWPLISNLISEASRKLRRRGIFLMVLSSLTKPFEEAASLLTRQGFEVKWVERLKLFFEELRVLKAVLL